MSLSESHILLFVSADYIGLKATNMLVPKLLEQGLTPVLLDTGSRKNRRFRNAPIPEVSFYNVIALEKAIVPFLEERPTPPIQNSGLNKTYRQLALAHNLPYHVIHDVNDLQTRTVLATYKNSTLGSLCLRMLQVFSQETITAIKKQGFFWNMHSGSLPDYKGLLAPYHALLNNEKNYGWTLHEVQADIDVGNIINRCERPLMAEKPVFETYLEIIPAALEMLSVTVSDMHKNIPLKTIRNAGGHYYSYPTAHQMAELERQGVRYMQSMDHFIDKAISDFSIPQTRHASELRDRITIAYQEFFQPSATQKRTGTRA